VTCICFVQIVVLSYIAGNSSVIMWVLLCNNDEVIKSLLGAVFMEFDRKL